MVRQVYGAFVQRVNVHTTICAHVIFVKCEYDHYKMPTFPQSLC